MNNPFEQYENRKRDFEIEARKRKVMAGHISNARLVFFLAAATGFVGGLFDLFQSTTPAYLIGATCLAVFVVLVVLHDRVFGAMKRYLLLVKINEHAISRMGRNWEGVPHMDVPSSVLDNPIAVDLDLFSGGPRKASLLGLMGYTGTATGQKTILDWILNPAQPGKIVARQKAVDELSQGIQLRQEFELQAKLMPSPSPDVEPFLDWAKSKPWMTKSLWRIWAARLLTVNVWVFVGLHIAGYLPYMWLGMALLNLLYTIGFGRKALEIFDTVSSRKRAFDAYAKLFELACLSDWKSPELKRLQTELTAHNILAHKQLRRLDRLGTMADVRFSPMLFVPLQALTMWSFHVLDRLERWQTKIGPSCKSWFHALGEVESLLAIAALRHENQDWNFPSISEESATVFAKELGHPLLQPTTCVTNNVTIGPAGMFQMITGSNMSGKSTLLRSIGLNVVLAQMGSVVFAKEMSMPPMILGTSFRVQDSIQAGVSFFMAELRRLKQIVDLSSDHKGTDGPVFFYLLDEILQGTNVIERQVAVQSVVARLLKNRALGAISTHDLSLAEANGLKEHCDPRHFTEQYDDGPDGPSMQFDYTLRKGVAPTVNALKLLKIVGLDPDS